MGMLPSSRLSRSRFVTYLVLSLLAFRAAVADVNDADVSDADVIAAEIEELTKEVIPDEIVPVTEAEITAEQKLLEWAVSEGAQVHVIIAHNKVGMRGLNASQDIPKGGQLLHIPDHLVLSMPWAPAAELAPYLLKELYSDASRLKPYFASFPNQEQVLTAYNFPEEYIPYLASDVMADQIHDYKHNAKEAWSGNLDHRMLLTLKQAVDDVPVSLEEYAWAAALIASRSFRTGPSVVSLVPIADMANHDPKGGNAFLEKHPNEAGFRFTAKTDIKKGEEVLISYEDDRNDILLVRYGFQDNVTEPNKLCAIDHHQFKHLHEAHLLSEEPIGKGEGLNPELDRLKSVFNTIEERLKSLGAIPDTHPHAAHLVKEFQHLRRLGVLYERSRLEHLQLDMLGDQIKEVERMLEENEKNRKAAAARAAMMKKKKRRAPRMEEL